MNVIWKNHEHALKAEPLEPVPPATANPTADEGLRLMIDRDRPGRTLGTLGEAELADLVAKLEANIAKKRVKMAAAGITE